jgi:hypothetical protein
MMAAHQRGYCRRTNAFSHLPVDRALLGLQTPDGGARTLRTVPPLIVTRHRRSSRLIGEGINFTGIRPLELCEP